jgi:hypothetical protein
MPKYLLATRARNATGYLRAIHRLKLRTPAKASAGRVSDPLRPMGRLRAMPLAYDCRFAHRWAAGIVLALGMASGVCAQQTSPQQQKNPQSAPGATIIVNPTEAECKQGWSANLRWSKEQFETFCTKLGASK